MDFVAEAMIYGRRLRVLGCSEWSYEAGVGGRLGIVYAPHQRDHFVVCFLSL